MLLLYIALAGALGSVCRHLAGNAIFKVTAPHSAIPFGTFAVNVLGSFAIGAVIAYAAARGELDTRTRVAITTGFLGGFTTYSAFAYETISLIETQRVVTAALYVGLTFVTAVVGCFAGVLLGRAIAG